MAKLFVIFCTSTLLVEEFLLATVEAAVIVVLALLLRILAVEAFVSQLRALELGLIGSRRDAAAIWGVLNLATFFTFREAFSTGAIVTEAEAAIGILAARIIALTALTADLVVSITGPGAAFPEGTTEVGTGSTSWHTAIDLVGEGADGAHVWNEVFHFLLGNCKRGKARNHNSLHHFQLFNILIILL